MKLEALRAAGWARDLDVELVRRLEGAFGRPGGEDGDVRVLLALASAATGGGDVCLPLEANELQATLQRRAEEKGLEDPQEGTDGAKQGLVRPEDVFRVARAGAGKLGESGLAGAAEAGRPFVVEAGRLYLRRYWRYEEETARRLLELAESGTEDMAGAEITEEDEARLTDEQKAALRAALAARVTVITGGPGTGKTTVAGRLLKILMRQDRAKVVAVAPTGKAAARLKESLAKEDGEIARAVEAMTVDRLLGWKPGPYFRHDAENPLRENVVVVDETSMLDLPKAAKLLRALEKDTRLVLLGDAHQLSSVDPGNVMAEICDSERIKASRVKWLTKNLRSQKVPDLQELAETVREGKKEEAWAKLTGGGGCGMARGSEAERGEKPSIRRAAGGWIPGVQGGGGRVGGGGGGGEGGQGGRGPEGAGRVPRPLRDAPRAAGDGGREPRGGEETFRGTREGEQLRRAGGDDSEEHPGNRALQRRRGRGARGEGVVPGGGRNERRSEGRAASRAEVRAGFPVAGTRDGVRDDGSQVAGLGI